MHIERGGGMVDCHIHMVLDGIWWKDAIGRHSQAVQKDFCRKALGTYQGLGFTYLRDGGDRWGVGAYARSIAGKYGITYRTPLAPLSKQGHYGGFIGKQYADLKEYRRLVTENREQGADFIKIMISGLMDFDQFGVLTQPGLPGDEIKELIHIAHEEGMAVMAHANGARTVEAAAAAGVDSVEHGAYLDRAALQTMADMGTVWVPTLSTVGNLLGKGRFDETQVRKILDSALENVAEFSALGGLLAPGTDGGAWAVPHGSVTEYQWLAQIGIQKADLEAGIREIIRKF